VAATPDDADLEESSVGFAIGVLPDALQALTNRMARKATAIKTRIEALLVERRPD